MTAASVGRWLVGWLVGWSGTMVAFHSFEGMEAARENGERFVERIFFSLRELVVTCCCLLFLVVVSCCCCCRCRQKLIKAMNHFPRHFFLFSDCEIKKMLGT